ncbi:uncharacterized protein OCT59_024819 [Rhizophagus irregularis]|uniref:uncharacterized protein n=1 Tax=Rhizophagus irregularis TaxID=588596 RepID=UPI00332FB0DB|nr:hypothetical protein OCT59_024819 [Rhizophagus irregularis]
MNENGVLGEHLFEMQDEIPIGMSGTGRQKLAKIAQFEKRPLEKPNPQVSDHSIPTSNWNIPLSHKSNVLNTEIIDTDLGSRQVLNHTSNFALSSGWALKENQK